MSETGNSRVIVTNQDGVHEQLKPLVLKHLSTRFHKPIQAHTQAAFLKCKEWVEAQGKPIIFDSCCGVGESTAAIAKRHPEHAVIGIDKSFDRLSKHEPKTLDNYFLVQANLNDFWRLAAREGWQLSYHYILYPNPWPKGKHLKRRWHGSAVFPYILELGGTLEMRSNWELYLLEFSYALTLAKKTAIISDYVTRDAITPFERKYSASGQKLYRLRSSLT